MTWQWPWRKDEPEQPVDDLPTPADLAKQESEEQLVFAHTRWPEVLRLKVDLDAERTKNHFAERWERELRANARGL